MNAFPDEVCCQLRGLWPTPPPGDLRNAVTYIATSRQPPEDTQVTYTDRHGAVDATDIRRSSVHTGAMGVGCSLTGWSAVASAPANTTLAAVLAGFMINGIILLLSRKPAEMSAKYIQALSLLFAAFIILGLDAYLFSLVTGDSTEIIGKVSACRRAWTEAMFAAGLLAVGTVAIVVGFVILFDAYFRSGMKTQSGYDDSLTMLSRLCNVIRVGVAIVTIDLLFLSVRSYLRAVFDGNVPILATVFIHLYLYGGISAIVIITGLSLIKSKPSRRYKYLNRISNWWLTSDEDNTQRLFKSLKFAIFSSVGYTMISVIAAAEAASLAARDWNPTSLWVRLIIAATVVWVSMASLVPILLLLARTSPDFETKHSGTPALNHPAPEATVDQRQ